MPMGEIKDWVSYYNENPPGDRWTHMLLATIAAMIANACGDKNAKPQDFYSYMEGGSGEESAEDRETRLRAVMMGFGKSG